MLATDTAKGEQSLIDARRRGSESLWPEAHYLSPLHPVLDWAADRALARLHRGEVYAVRGDVVGPTMLLVGTLNNRRGQSVRPRQCRPGASPAAWSSTSAGSESPASRSRVCVSARSWSTPGPLRSSRTAVAAGCPRGGATATGQLDAVLAAATEDATARIRAWSERTLDWQQRAAQLTQRLDLKQRRLSVAEEERLIRELAPTTAPGASALAGHARRPPRRLTEGA